MYSKGLKSSKMVKKYFFSKIWKIDTKIFQMHFIGLKEGVPNGTFLDLSDPLPFFIGFLGTFFMILFRNKILESLKNAKVTILGILATPVILDTWFLWFSLTELEIGQN